MRRQSSCPSDEPLQDETTTTDRDADADVDIDDDLDSDRGLEEFVDEVQHQMDLFESSRGGPPTMAQAAQDVVKIAVPPSDVREWRTVAQYAILCAHENDEDEIHEAAMGMLERLTRESLGEERSIELAD